MTKAEGDRRSARASSNVEGSVKGPWSHGSPEPPERPEGADAEGGGGAAKASRARRPARARSTSAAAGGGGGAAADVATAGRASCAMKMGRPGPPVGCSGGGDGGAAPGGGGGDEYHYCIEGSLIPHCSKLGFYNDLYSDDTQTITI